MSVFYKIWNTSMRIYYQTKKKPHVESFFVGIRTLNPKKGIKSTTTTTKKKLQVESFSAEFAVG